MTVCGMMLERALDAYEAELQKLPGNNSAEPISLSEIRLRCIRTALTAALSEQVPKNAKPAYWTHDAEAAKSVGHLYYFAPTNRAKPPYRHQRHVNAIIDIAADGTLAGVELIDDMPPPPSSTAGESQGG